jgi:hypothetical protein
MGRQLRLQLWLQLRLRLRQLVVLLLRGLELLQQLHKLRGRTNGSRAVMRPRGQTLKHA